MRTRDQRLAALVWAQVSQVPAEQIQQYGSAAHRLPILIRSTGLVQALAFMRSRNKDGVSRLIDDLAEAVLHLPSQLTDEKRTGEEKAPKHHGEALLAQSRDGDLSDYMLLTVRSLQTIGWMRRFVKSELHIEPTDDSDRGEPQIGAEHATP